MLTKAVILDDEQYCIDSLTQKLLRFPHHLTLEHTFTNARSAIDYLNQHKTDLLFLDINLGSLTGFDVIEQLEKPIPRIIFTTAYDHHAIRAFKYNALDYLLKPIDEEELQQSLERFEQEGAVFPGITEIESAVKTLKNKVQDIQKIALPTLQGFEIIELKNLVRLEANSNYTHFITEDGKRTIISKTLKEYEDLLEPEGFVRIHQSHIINMQFIKRFVKSKNPVVVMQDGTELDVSATRKEYFMEQFKNNFRLS
jgi:two-component system, LytTR family, response regulator